MNKVLTIFRETSALKLIIISLVFVSISYFIEKSLPSIFLGLRLLAFILFVFGLIRLLNLK